MFRMIFMKKLNVNYKKVDVRCSCGNLFYIYSTFEKKLLNINVCNMCNSFCSGKKKIVNVEGRVDNFYKKFNTILKK